MLCLLAGHKARGQGQGLGHKKSEAKAKGKSALPRIDPLDAKNRIAQGHRRMCSQKKGIQKNFQAIYKILTVQNILLSSSRGQGNF